MKPRDSRSEVKTYWIFDQSSRRYYGGDLNGAGLPMWSDTPDLAKQHYDLTKISSIIRRIKDHTTDLVVICETVKTTVTTTQEVIRVD
jgi:hypothetical protein